MLKTKFATFSIIALLLLKIDFIAAVEIPDSIKVFLKEEAFKKNESEFNEAFTTNDDIKKERYIIN
ncbi:MAG: hypothetical protein IPO21_09885 [Bacteroidales bacterium]|nr:hypothetical protein [Bacteroidales bacterium]